MKYTNRLTRIEAKAVSKYLMKINNAEVEENDKKILGSATQKIFSQAMIKCPNCGYRTYDDLLIRNGKKRCENCKANKIKDYEKTQIKKALANVAFLKVEHPKVYPLVWRYIIKAGRKNSNGEWSTGLYTIIKADKDSIVRSAIDMWPEAFENNL